MGKSYNEELEIAQKEVTRLLALIQSLQEANPPPVGYK